ncbi:unnamed protein product [Arctia plantaginis]|uniref:Uncharacterized protein n=1 Tax=Arctia plantaginis TaxID=874455 RepID=A0A8S1BJ91_ARCPL|nr:unnamed protein product [Arctia plantaginis]
MKTIIFTVFVKIVTAQCLSCDDVLDLPLDEKVSLSALQTMSAKDIVQCLAHLGKEELPTPEADFIWKSLITFYDGIEHIPDSVLMILHWVTAAVSPEDYANMSLSNIDVVQNFGLYYKLNEAQIAAIANRVREDFAEKEPEDYTSYDLTALGQILCAFNKSEIERINPSAYKETAALIGKLERCNGDAMSGFATLAVEKRAFGPSSNWTDNIIKTVGKVADFLPKGSIKKKKPV